MELKRTLKRYQTLNRRMALAALFLAQLPLQLFADRNYAVGSVAIVTLGFMAASMMLPLMLWLQNEKGLPGGTAVILVAPLARPPAKQSQL